MHRGPCCPCLRMRTVTEYRRFRAWCSVSCGAVSPALHSRILPRRRTVTIKPVHRHTMQQHNNIHLDLVVQYPRNEGKDVLYRKHMVVSSTKHCHSYRGLFRGKKKCFLAGPGLRYAPSTVVALAWWGDAWCILYCIHGNDGIAGRYTLRYSIFCMDRPKGFAAWSCLSVNASTAVSIALRRSVIPGSDCAQSCSVCVEANTLFEAIPVKHIV